MRVSIVIAVLDSHEIVHRQLMHFRKHNLPPAVEFILVDDGSKPPVGLPPGWKAEGQEHDDEQHSGLSCENVRILRTNDFRRWTQGLARMKGIEAARGEYIFCTDIDHILSKESLEFALKFDGDKANFQRRFAYLDEEGNLVRDREKVIAWGLNPAAIRDKELSSGFHGNTWLMRKQVFKDLGGYNLDRCNSGTHLQGEDREFNKRCAVAQRKGTVKPTVTGPPIYFFPMGRFHVTGDENPFGMFHSMKKEKWGDAITA